MSDSVEDDLERFGPTALRIADERNDLLAALKSVTGYLLNGKIDLETGAPKRTALTTIDGGLTLARAAIAKAQGEQA